MNTPTSSSSVVPPHQIRASFSAAMSNMYKEEVPLYGRLLDIVREVNADVLRQNPRLEEELGDLDRVSAERHGAIRLGTPDELRTMAEVFGSMAMLPVGYYDLSVAGLPIHSTAFRPVTKEELAKNPFRVFTSLLRTDLLDPEIRSEAEKVLARRDIFTPRLRELLKVQQAHGGFTAPEAEEFISESLQTFRWHASAMVSRELYNKFLKINGLLADIACFRGPHINHLTPRVLDIYRVHQRLQAMDIETIPEVQGPPDDCPILLKQTSFRALNEAIQFPEEDGSLTGGNHRARFGEIESRSCAITPEARDLYDRLISEVNQKAKVLRENNSPEEYRKTYPTILNQVFRSGFPAWTFEDLRRKNLGYFHYQVRETASDSTEKTPEIDFSLPPEEQMDSLIRTGQVVATPITYEDFLPVSAAGIFKSNLDEQSGAINQADPNQVLFEESLGREVLNPFTLYQREQAQSIEEVLQELSIPAHP